MSDYTKELKESLGFGLVFATLKAGFDYLSGRKPSIMSFAKNGGIAAGADVIYQYGLVKALFHIINKYGINCSNGRWSRGKRFGV